MVGEMLKPLEALTRSLPPRPPARPQWPATGPPPPGATSEAQPAEPAAASVHSNGNAAAASGQPDAPAAAPPQVGLELHRLCRIRLQMFSGAELCLQQL